MVSARRCRRPATILGCRFYRTDQERLYTYTGTGPFGGWDKSTAAADIAGQITEISNNAVSTPKLQAGSVVTPNLVAGAVVADKIGAGEVTAAKMASTLVSAMFGSFGTMIAGEIYSVTIATASTGTRAVLEGAQPMFYMTDPNYASATYYTAGNAEPSWLFQGGGFSGAGYCRVLSYNATIAVNGGAYGTGATPFAQGGYFFGSFVGATGQGGGVGLQGIGTSYDFYASGAGSNYGPFTASHDAIIDKEDEVEAGDILETVEMVMKKSISTTLRRVRRASGAATVRRCGVFTGDRAPVDDFNAPSAISLLVFNQGTCLDPAYDDFKDLYDRVSMNALGEGQVYVCDEVSTEWRIVQLIVQSGTVPGKGMHQDDDVIHSYTAARCEEDVDLESGVPRKVACTYLNAEEIQHVWLHIRPARTAGHDAVACLQWQRSRRA